MHRLRSSTLLTSLFVLAACAADDDDPDAADDTGEATDADTDDGAADETGGGDGSGGSGGPDVAELYACEDPDFTVVQPMFGPGFDPETGEMVEPLADEYVVSTTQILLKPDPAAQETFFELNNAVVAQLMQTPGFLGVSFASEPNCGFARTLGVWESEEAMYGFVTTGAHLEAMGQTFEVAVTGRTTSFTLPAAQMPPSWDVALEQIADVAPIGGY
jgi:hypothetical protein